MAYLIESANVKYSENYIETKYNYETTRVLQQQNKLLVINIAFMWCLKQNGVYLSIGFTSRFDRFRLLLKRTRFLFAPTGMYRNWGLCWWGGVAITAQQLLVRCSRTSWDCPGALRMGRNRLTGLYLSVVFLAYIF